MSRKIQQIEAYYAGEKVYMMFNETYKVYKARGSSKIQETKALLSGNKLMQIVKP